MDQAIEKQGWIWIDISDPEHLDKTKTYKIGIGNEHWHLRYGGLHEWFASKVAGEHEVPANALVKAGCPIFMRRQPEVWQGAGMVQVDGDKIILSQLEGQRLPLALDRLVVLVKLTEILDLSTLQTEPEAVGDDMWSRS